MGFHFYDIPRPKNRGSSVTWATPSYFDQCTLPKQGYKIHISATVNNCGDILDAAYPYLYQMRAPFKIIGSLSLLRKFNGDEFGYSQSGKYITVYTSHSAQCKEVAEYLSEKLSLFRSHIIPFDLRYKKDSIVFIRYGSFNAVHGERSYLIKPDGTKILDDRYGDAIPSWVRDNPFVILQQPPVNDVLLFNRFVVAKIIQQRSKGGVLLVVDLKHASRKPKLIVLKEARQLGEVDESGVDAVQRLRWQENITNIFSDRDMCPRIEVPYTEVSSGAILGFEYIRSRNLAQIMLGKRVFKVSEAIDLTTGIARKINKMHACGIYFFDLAPPNILLAKDKEFLIDFEYAYSIHAPAFPGWAMGTIGFAPRINIIDVENFSFTQKLISRDIFALAGILLAMICKDWYKDLIKNAYYFDQDFGVTAFIDSLENNMKNVLLKARMMSNRYYHELNEFTRDLEKLKNVN